MERQHTNTERITSLSDYLEKVNNMLIDHLLNGYKPKEIWVECEVHDVNEGGDAID